MIFMLNFNNIILKLLPLIKKLKIFTNQCFILKVYFKFKHDLIVNMLIQNMFFYSIAYLYEPIKFFFSLSNH